MHFFLYVFSAEIARRANILLTPSETGGLETLRQLPRRGRTNSYQLLMMLIDVAEYLRRLSLFLFEDTVEVGYVVEAAVVAYLCYRGC